MAAGADVQAAVQQNKQPIDGLARRPELRTEALGYAASALDRGLYVGHRAPAFAPGFFRGMAGIGYQCLRLAFPDTIPSILLWS